MRLEPIDRPPGLIMRIAFWMMRRQFGKVMMPMKVVIARMPGALRLSYELSKFELKGLRLDPELHYLIGSLTAQINGCGFCADLGRAMAIQKHMQLKKFDALLDFRASPLFSDRERAALAYAEEATRHKRVSDATFAELRSHFVDWEIAEITWINAVENYYNMVNIPLEIEADGFCAIALARR